MWDVYSEWLLLILCEEYVYDFKKVAEVISHNYLDFNINADDCRR